MSDSAPALWMVCPTCGVSWPGGTENCPADGAALIAAKTGIVRMDDEPLPEGTMVGEYKIESLLGTGGMGEVYSARHPMIGKQVAIKVMNRACSANPINVDRFVQEAKAVNAIGHANIVDIFSFGKMRDGRCFFVMEKLRGESLRARLDHGPMVLATACTIVESVLRALEAAHAAKIVHRDLKPDNIFLVAARDGEPERVKLLDFGIAKLSGAGTAQPSTKTDTGTVVGTPTYMAPEQAAGTGVEAASDIYALGVVLFEMATGLVPFTAASTVQIMAMHVCDEAPAPSSLYPVPPELDRLVLAMLRKKPSERPAHHEIRAALATIRELPPLPPRTETPNFSIAFDKKETSPTAAARPLALQPTGVAPASAVLTTPLPVKAASDADARAATVASEPAIVLAPSAPLQLAPRDPARPRGPLPAASGVVAPQRSTSTTKIVLGAVVVLGAGGVVAWKLTSKAAPKAVDAPVWVAGTPAPAPAPAPPATDDAKPVWQQSGVVVVDVAPADARVEIDGAINTLVKGHLERTLRAGTYTIVASHAGYDAKTTPIEVTGGKDNHVTIVLAKTHAAPAIGVTVKVPPVAVPVVKKKPIDVDAPQDPFADPPPPKGKP